MSGEYLYITSKLNELGIDVITTSPIKNLPYYERFHSDMQCSYYKAGYIFLTKSSEYMFNILTNKNISVEILNTDVKAKYPNNILFNNLIIKNKILCNIKYTSKEILKHCKENNFDIIDTKQGYTKCSTAVVSENAVITADNNIYIKCIENKIDVLKINYGGINLYGYDYGFIGGCCGKISNDILAFTGKISEHKDYKEIKSFMRNYNVYALELSNKPLNDIGGIIPVLC